MKRNIKKQLSVLLIVICMITVLTGCLYPEDQRKDQASTGEYVVVVQQAVDNFKRDKGILPIKNSDSNSRIYEKYIIQFTRLTNQGYLSQIPTDAFENGGKYYYVLIDVETKPTVKLMNIVTLQQVVDVQNEVIRYMNSNGGQAPNGEPITEGIYRLDFEKLNKPVVQVSSPYSGMFLSLLVNDQGEVTIDYAPEIAQKLTKLNLEAPDPTVDLTRYLIEDSYFIPVASDTYHWIEGKPKAVQ